MARKKALKNSTSMSADLKSKVEPLLKAAYMSSDESVLSCSSDEGENALSEPSRKKVRKHMAVWRSDEFQEYISSLDRKIQRKRTERGKTMVLTTVLGENSLRSAPDDCPDWAKTLFD